MVLLLLLLMLLDCTAVAVVSWVWYCGCGTVALVDAVADFCIVGTVVGMHMLMLLLLCAVPLDGVEARVDWLWCVGVVSRMCCCSWMLVLLSAGCTAASIAVVVVDVPTDRRDCLN